MIGLQVSPKVTCTEAAKAPFQRSHSFRMCATLDLQIGSPRLQGNPRKWELLATAPDKGGSGKAETTAGVPEVTARAEVPTTLQNPHPSPHHVLLPKVPRTVVFRLG